MQGYFFPTFWSGRRHWGLKKKPITLVVKIWLACIKICFPIEETNVCGRKSAWFFRQWKSITIFAGDVSCPWMNHGISQAFSFSARTWFRNTLRILHPCRCHKKTASRSSGRIYLTRRCSRRRISINWDGLVHDRVFFAGGRDSLILGNHCSSV